jgi:hypothetical protein
MSSLSGWQYVYYVQFAANVVDGVWDDTIHNTRLVIHLQVMLSVTLCGVIIIIINSMCVALFQPESRNKLINK